MGKYSVDKSVLEVMQDTASKLRLLRRGANMSQAELAERSGVSLGSLKRFEQSGQISLESLLKLLLILDRLKEFDGLFEGGEDLQGIEKLFSS